MLAGLKDKLMAPDVAAEAMRAYQEERNRLNRERRLSGDQDRRALEKAEKAIKEIVAAIEDGRYSRTLGDRLATLEKEQDALGERLGQAPQDLPDLHPNIAEHYRRRIERLITALASPDVTPDAGEAIRSLVERVTLAPGAKRGEMLATLHGDLGTILEWTERTGRKSKTDIPSAGMSVSVVAGECNQRYLQPLRSRIPRVSRALTDVPTCKASMEASPVPVP